MTIQTISGLRTGGATGKKDQPEWTDRPSAVRSVLCSSLRGLAEYQAMAYTHVYAANVPATGGGACSVKRKSS